MITNHRARTALATAVGFGLSAQIHVAPTSTPPATSTVFFRTHTGLGRLELRSAGESTSLTNCAHARVGNVEDCEVT